MKIGKIIDEFNELPEELVTPKNILLLDPAVRDKILTKQRLEILAFLKEHNPITIKDMTEIFKKNPLKDLKILNHINLVLFEKVNENFEETIVKLNREISTYPRL